jgi:6-phosphogluconolactonase (cycloisomerase 2 family)
MISRCSFDQGVCRVLELCACAALVIGISTGCGGGSTSSPSNLSAPATSNSAAPGSSSGSGSSAGSTNSGSSGANGGGSSAGGSAGTSGTPVASTGFLYVGLDDSFSLWSTNTNTGHPSIAGFAVASDGTLSATPGSPYTSPAAALAVSPAASALYAASGPKLNVDHINADGSLTTTQALSSQPLPTVGVYWDLSFDAPAQTLYALAAHGSGTSFFEIYKTGGDGALTANGSQEVDVASSHPYFTPDGNRAYQPFCYHLDGEVFGYTAGADGKLIRFDTRAPMPNFGESFPACPYALSISADGAQLAAQLNAKSGNASALGIYAINTDGTLTAQAGSPFLTTAQGSDIAWDPSGRYVAVAAKDGLWIYSVTGTTVAPLGGAPIVAGPMDHLAFNKSGTLLFATSASVQDLYVFEFNSSTGLVTPASGSPHKLNLTPYELVLSEK